MNKVSLEARAKKSAKKRDRELEIKWKKFELDEARHNVVVALEVLLQKYRKRAHSPLAYSSKGHLFQCECKRNCQL